MSYKKILFHNLAREKILEGVNILSETVRLTLGPKSKCVLLQRKWGHPIVCNDGVTIAKAIELKDPENNLGAQMIRETAERTGDAVGDGTSTSIVIAQEIYSEGLHNVAAGASAVDLKHGLEKALSVSVNTIKSLSKSVSTSKEKAQVAAISAHNDSSIGVLVAQAMDKVGSEGVVTVEEAKGTETHLEVVEGMQFDRGYLSPYFVTDSEKMAAILEAPYILLCEKKVAGMQELVPLLEEVSKTSAALLIIADDFENDALATLVVNKIRGVLHCAAVKAPGFGDRKKNLLQDLAVLTGGILISEDAGLSLAHITLKDLGRCSRVVIDKENTTIVGGLGKKELIEDHKEEIRRQLQKTKSEYDKGKLEERLAKLSGGIGVIYVGAPSEAELKNRKEALEDAISATRAAIAEGVVPGGGLSLLRASKALVELEGNCEGDEKTGVKILRKALEGPTRQIAANSGADGGVVVEKMMSHNGSYGFDASKNEFVDLVEAGIIDPTKVVRIALENAVSVASVLLLTEATLVDIGDEKEKGIADYPEENKNL
ncbi:chaperonin GroEL [Bdellovibrio sp. NC01]|uniref:chaperonin GroEL n=1 Tax=Bdellovibrio sp. NC01 TaxID=2220073 RepID=UPI0011574E64|nr:chaperonin GroEL [Bdellovibrio sp. NC01]QDK38617.1 chaperonin GroEL [Bdellovibrio sp. NC01]